MVVVSISFPFHIPSFFFDNMNQCVIYRALWNRSRDNRWIANSSWQRIRWVSALGRRNRRPATSATVMSSCSAKMANIVSWWVVFIYTYEVLLNIFSAAEEYFEMKWCLTPSSFLGWNLITRYTGRGNVAFEHLFRMQVGGKSHQLRRHIPILGPCHLLGPGILGGKDCDIDRSRWKSHQRRGSAGIISMGCWIESKVKYLTRIIFENNRWRVITISMVFLN